MTVPSIGLEALFETAKFADGLREYLDGIQDAEGKTKSASNSIQAGMAAIGGTVVIGAIAGVTAAIGAVTAAATASIATLINWTGTVDSMGDVLGTNAEDSSALAVAIRYVGGNVEGITGQMAYLTKGLVDAEGKIGATGEVLDDLGISFKDAEGNILPATDILTKVADHLSTMPDGLKKTTLMTRLFGKSGKDLTDTLNALTTEGFAEASAMAEELGLSMKDEAVSGTIELQKKFEWLKMAGEGLFVSLGEQLAPALSDLTDEFMELVMGALPKVREMLPEIAEIVKNIAGFIIDSIPVVFKVISDVFDFLINNKPLIIGVLAAIAAAVAVWAYTTISTLIPALMVTITTLAPAIAVIAAIGAVVAAVAWAWENNFMGMRDVITQFWTEKVQPILQTLWTWLQVNVPAAIQTLTNYWKDVLWPAIQDVWDWMQDVLFPFLESIANFLSTVFGVAVQELSDLWSQTFLPALQEIWSWMTEKLFPAFQDIVDWLENKLSPVFRSAADTVRETLGSAFEWVTERLQSLTNWFNNLSGNIRGAGAGGNGGSGAGGNEGSGSSGAGGDNGSSIHGNGGGGGKSGKEGIATSSRFVRSPSTSSRNVVNNFNFGNNTFSSAVDGAALDARVRQTVHDVLKE